jgi:hypothetical protein
MLTTILPMCSRIFLLNFCHFISPTHLPYNSWNCFSIPSNIPHKAFLLNVHYKHFESWDMLDSAKRILVGVSLMDGSKLLWVTPTEWSTTLSFITTIFVSGIGCGCCCEILHTVSSITGLCFQCGFEAFKQHPRVIVFLWSLLWSEFLN